MQMGGTARDAVIGIMTAYGESRLVNIPTPNAFGAYGLFQQRPSQGWGTVAPVTNPQYAARKFFSVELKVGNRDAMDPGQVAVTVQRPGVGPSYYDQFQTMATQVVNLLAGGQGTSSVANSPAFSAGAANGKAGKTGCVQLLGVALGVVKSNPAIAYREGGDSPYN